MVLILLSGGGVLFQHLVAPNLKIPTSESGSVLMWNYKYISGRPKAMCTGYAYMSVLHQRLRRCITRVEESNDVRPDYRIRVRGGARGAARRRAASETLPANSGPSADWFPQAILAD
ncbi:hypothetical protein EVAR_10727_1 [Eumeta japonica]|uniref:Uncharacterized protein n=1 Tax=Eumeta variegata TaxID=151549 RepID=A0A4C1U7Y2_EUMVA|nr:hypothetical protein EVAR_10727_1 [Eumeta japonica]